MSSARKCAERLSDDALRLIYSLDEENWNNQTKGEKIIINGHDLPKSSKIFLSILKFANQILTTDGEAYKVKFEYLFKWRDITRLIGEDLIIVSRMAMGDAYSFFGSKGIGYKLTYPSSLRNDDPDIKALIETGNLHELHCHLNATANIFNINWACLMNYPQKRLNVIGDVIRKKDGEIDKLRLHRIHELLIHAAWFRFTAYQYLKGEIDREKVKLPFDGLKGITTENDAQKLRNDIQAYSIIQGFGVNGFGRDILETSPSIDKLNNILPDYIFPPNIRKDCQGDFRIYLGERYFLYLSMLHILRKEDRPFAGAFRYYLLVKGLFRREMIQLNKNHGFANFKRYQDVKSMFLRGYPAYQRMLSSLAVGDAWRDSNIAYQEVRIAPEKKLRKGKQVIEDIHHSIDSELEIMNQSPEFVRRPEIGIIYHFIKLKEKPSIKSNINVSNLSTTPRNHNIRKDLRKQSYIIRTLFKKRKYKIKGIDAASSEFNCRPEVFGQAFRFLKSSGLKATFHAGEDFYDISDGLRAIDEAVTLLGMTSGDRIGHAIAMGIDSGNFYSKRENHVIVPAQWMLDNVAWLLIRSGEWNITIEPTVESFLRAQYNNLFSMIYGRRDSDYIPVEKYYKSLLLRGDNPDWYRRSDEGKGKGLIFTDSWEAFELLDPEKARTAKEEERIRELYLRYHYDTKVRAKGEKVIEFKVCKGYCRLIEAMQQKMIERLERRHIIIESCPSSNVLIGSLDKYRNHPAFRFYSVDGEKRNHLKVTLNTDDLGVFQTSLANEYSYMALALSKERDENDNNVFMPYHINEWLKAIAENGIKAKF